MSSVNKVILIGRLGKDPESKEVNGNTVTKMSIATTKKWKKNGQDHERTEWHNVVVWGKLAEVAAKYLTKGRQAYLEGELQTRNYEDQQGVKRYITEVVVNVIQFIGAQDGGNGGGNGGGGNKGHGNGSAQAHYNADDGDSEIPF